MAKKKTFSSKFEGVMSRDAWRNICPTNSYKIFDPETAIDLKLVHKNLNNPNCTIVCASAISDKIDIYISNMHRYDNGKIDQEPYFELYYGNNERPYFHGLFHHMTYENRSITLSDYQIKMVNNYGSSTELTYFTKPKKTSGLLKELQKQGLLVDYEFIRDSALKLTRKCKSNFY